MFWFFVILVVLFVGYAVWTQWGNTTPANAPAKRLLQALGFALAAIASIVAAWFHSAPTP